MKGSKRKVFVDTEAKIHFVQKEVLTNFGLLIRKGISILR